MKVAVLARNFFDCDGGAVKLLTDAGFELLDYTSTPVSTEAQVADAVADAEVVVSALEPIGDEVLSKCPNIKFISRRGIGYDSIDVPACRAAGIGIARTTGAVEAAVAEHILAYMLYFARRVHEQDHYMKKGEWKRIMMPGLKGATIGLVGFGGIGQEVAKRAAAFDMNILYYCRTPRPQQAELYNAQFCSLEELLGRSDYVNVSVPLTDSTRGLFSDREFSMMKPGSIFINTSRGPVADAAALKRALDSGHLGGAGIDVFDVEPCTDSPLISCENALLTPHTAPFTGENFRLMNRLCAENIVNYFNGTLEEKYIVYE